MIPKATLATFGDRAFHQNPDGSMVVTVRHELRFEGGPAISFECSAVVHDILHTWAALQRSLDRELNRIVGETFGSLWP